jgi:hypothetical protein
MGNGNIAKSTIFIFCHDGGGIWRRAALILFDHV